MKVNVNWVPIRTPPPRSGLFYVDIECDVFIGRWHRGKFYYTDDTEAPMESVSHWAEIPLPAAPSLVTP